MFDQLPKILLEKFVCDKYMFQLCGDMATEMTYKVTCISYNKITPDIFYNDIMYNEKINFYLGIYSDGIIIDKKAYINIIEDTNSYYMMLNIKLLELDTYYNTILSSTRRFLNIRDEFSEITTEKYKYPSSVVVNELQIGSNPFSNIYHVSINISNVGDSAINEILNQIYPKVIVNLGNFIKKKINQNKIFKIGVEYRFIATYGYRTVKLLGFIIPITIEGIRILSITENSIMLEESDKWTSVVEKNSNKINVANIIASLYNKNNSVYLPFEVSFNEHQVVNGNKFVKVVYNSALLVLNDKLSELDILDNDNIPTLNFIPFSNNDGNIKIYKNINKKDIIKYCGFVIFDEEEKLFNYVASSKSLKHSKLEFFYIDTSKAYFIIKQKKFNFKSIYNLIKSKLYRGELK